jgi:hypothetical protein
MKINRNDLKAIVKECLLEIMVEGLGARVEEKIEESYAAQPRQVQRQVQQPRERRPLTTPFTPAPSGRPRAAAARQSAAVSVFAGQSVGAVSLTEILKDTETNTLPQMAAAPDPEAMMGRAQMMYEGPSYDEDGPLPQPTADDPYPGLTNMSEEQKASVWDRLITAPTRIVHPPAPASIPREVLDAKVG